MSYEWDPKRAHRKSVIRFLAALVLPAVLLSSAIAVAEWARDQSLQVQPRKRRQLCIKDARLG